MSGMIQPPTDLSPSSSGYITPSLLLASEPAVSSVSILLCVSSLLSQLRYQLLREAFGTPQQLKLHSPSARGNLLNPNIFKLKKFFLSNHRVQCGAQTHDPKIKSHMLY